MKLTELQCKVLTEELLGDRWHKQYLVGNLWYCKCGKEYCSKGIEDNRTFDNWQDLGAVKEKIVEKGLWKDFMFFCEEKFGAKDNTIMPWCYQFFEWLFRPTDESGEPHFARLVAEFLEGRK